jgi:dipeptidyl aminopeptidase/acylaminoacyl peptidase
VPSDILTRTPIAARQRVAYGADSYQFFDVFPAQTFPAQTPGRLAIMIHGGFWRSKYDLTHASHLCSALAATGVTTISLEYRRVGTGGGWPATFEDIEAGYAKALIHFKDAKAPVVLGHSAGGHLALRLAATNQAMAGIVALAPVACLRLAFKEHLGDGAVEAFLNGTPAEIPSIYDAAEACNKPSNIRRILVHGVEDEIVPIANSQAFVEARKHDPGVVTLIDLKATGHLELIDPSSDAWPTVRAAVDSL